MGQTATAHVADAAIVTDRDRLTVRRILKVNHAGEHGAIRIYGAQIAVSRWLYADLVPVLEELRAHEIEHRQIFRSLMPSRAARPCRIMMLWSLGGTVLGGMTALLGRQAIWTCTAAVESAVHHHLDDQLHFLASRDREVHAAILAIREEELAHLRLAQGNLGPVRWFDQTIHAVVSASTHAVIWLSTWGDSTRMRHELDAARKAQ